MLSKLNKKEKNTQANQLVGGGDKKIKYPFMIETQVTRKKGEINLMKGIYQNPATSIMLNDNQLNDVKIRKKSMCPLWTLLLNCVLEILASAIRQEKGMKGFWFRKEEIKWSSFR